MGRRGKRGERLQRNITFKTGRKKRGKKRRRQTIPLIFLRKKEGKTGIHRKKNNKKG